MSVSIITITYNNFEELKKTLSSIPRSDILESVVINGGSDSNSINFLQSYEGVVVNEPDEGIADAFNKGIVNSRGDYIMFLNSGDELIDKEYPLKAKQILDSNNRYAFVHSNLKVVNRSGVELFMRPLLKNVGRGMLYLHPTMVVRKKVFNQIGGFNKTIKIAMDFDFIVRMEKEKIKGYYLNQNAPVRMEGRGKSVTEEGKAIRECYIILKENDFINTKNLVGFSIRFFLYLTRRFINTIGLHRLLSYLQRVKHSP